ncbi:DciA family protein [Pseudomonadota bacterium]
MEHFNSQLNPSIVSKAHHLEQLTLILDGVLPPETSGHYHVANIDNSTLVVITDSPVWTTRLRQLGPTIIETLSNQTGERFQHVRIISRHGSIETPPQVTPTINRVLSEASSQQLIQTAEHIKDKELKEALLKISKRSKKLD